MMLPRYSIISLIIIGLLFISTVSSATEEPAIIQAKLLDKAAFPGLSDISPYDEAVVLYTWEVEEVISGEMEHEIIGIFHWGFYDRIEQDIESWRTGRTRTLTVSAWATRPDLHSVTSIEPDEVDYAMPIFMDEGQEIRRGRLRGNRYNYGGRSGVSDRMTDLLYIRHVVKMVGFGDSRAKAGIVPQLFYPDEIDEIPVAYNMAYDSTGIRSLYDLTHEYLVHLPQLEVVVWNFSPRMLNTRWSGREIKIKDSPGNAYDRQHAEELWTDAEDAVILRSDQIDWQAPPFGWEVRRESGMGGSFPRRENPRSYAFHTADWARLQRVTHSLAEKGVHFIIFTPPIAIHPSRGAVDNDGTPREVHQQNMQRLQEMANQYPTVHIYDIHQSGNHDFGPEHFRDTDHVNKPGAEKLSRMLEAYRAQVMRHHRQLVVEYGDGEVVSDQELITAVREADKAVATLAATRLRNSEETDAFPALLERYLASADTASDDIEGLALRRALTDTIVEMAPELEVQTLAPLLKIISDDQNMQYPALVSLVARAIGSNDAIKQSFDTDAIAILSDFVTRAFQSGDEDLIAALPFAVAEDLGLPLQRIQVNFQRKNAPIPEGFIADYGKEKQEQGAYVFGWEDDNTGEARYHRDDHVDPRYATMNHFRNGPWSIDLPNGTYRLTLVTGDPRNTGQESHLVVNGTILSDTRPGAHFMRHEFSVTVSHGELVIKPAEYARNAKIVYVVIEGVLQ